MSGPGTQVPRRGPVAAGMLLAALLVGAIVGMTEVLRHPLPTGGPETPELPGGDPRAEVVCALPEAREGQDRPQAAAQPSLPVEVTSNALYDCPQTWDQREISYQGEVVGAVLVRGDGAWVQLNDDVYGDQLGPLPTHRDFRGGNAGVGVFLPGDLWERIGTVGGPSSKGDVLRVVGTFYRVDPLSDEVAVIRASELQIARRGGLVTIPLLRDRQVVAAITSATAVAAVLWARRRARLP